MNAEELNRLIEKYYNGESTAEEERVLRNHFNKNDISESYEAEKAIFGYYTTAGEVPEPSEDFEVRIMSGINAADAKGRSEKLRKYILPYLSAAAGLLILAGSYFFFTHRDEPDDTFTDPHIAYAETIKILTGVSSKLNRAAQTLEPVSKISEMTTKSFSAINKSAAVIEKNMEKLGHLQNAIEISKVPVNNKINK